MKAETEWAVNLEKLKKSIGFRVQLDPPAIHLDAAGQEISVLNEDWIVMGVTETYVSLHGDEVLPLIAKVGTDSVHHFSRNESRSIEGDAQYGFLTLALQIYIQNDVITYTPCRPGERVSPPPVQIVERLVDFSYPEKSGIQKKLGDAGYRVAWVKKSQLAGLELDGWEIVIEKDRQGRPSSFHLHDGLVYVKKRA